MTARQQIRVGRLARERSPIDAQPAPTVGEMLQAAREKKGVDLYRAERDTKIRARHLASLEAGDYGELPAPVYTKGFLRNYSLYLGLDPEELLTRWRDEQDYGRKGEPVAVMPPPQPLAEPGRGLTFTPGVVIAGVLSLIVLLFVGYIGLQLVRFSQVPAIALDGDRIIRLPSDATTVVLRGTAGAAAHVSVAGPDGSILETTNAEDTGAWAAEMGVNKGRNDFSLVARDADTGRESPPLEVSVIVAIPPTPRPAEASGAPISPAPVAASAAVGPGAAATATPVPTPTPVVAVAQLVLTAPSEGARIGNQLLVVRGISDAATVRVGAAWAGEGRRPRGPAEQSVAVRDGGFETRLPLPDGRWAVSVSTAGSDEVTPSVVTRTVQVRHSGVYVTVEARTGPARIRVWVDGEIEDAGQTLRRGETRAYTGKRSVIVSSSNGRATHVVVNGEPIGAIGKRDDTATMEFQRGRAPRPLS